MTLFNKDYDEVINNKVSSIFSIDLLGLKLASQFPTIHNDFVEYTSLKVDTTDLKTSP